jgi:Mn-dependent DtxR family transcriptional regulator
MEKLTKEDLLQIDGDYIRLTNKGLDFANQVWEEFV